MLAPLSAKMGGSEAKPLLFFIAFTYISDFWPHGADGVPHFLAARADGYPIFGRLDKFGNQLGAILGHLAARFGTGWAGGVPRSGKN